MLRVCTSPYLPKERLHSLPMMSQSRKHTSGLGDSVLKASPLLHLAFSVVEKLAGNKGIGLTVSFFVRLSCSNRHRNS